MNTSNTQSEHSRILKSVGERTSMETISKNRLTKIGNGLLVNFPKELHSAYMAAEARGLKAKDITLEDGTPIDPSNPASVEALKKAALAHMEVKGTVNTGPKKRDIAASFASAVEGMLEDVDTSAISEYAGWGFKVEYDGTKLEVIKVEKHRTK